MNPIKRTENWLYRRFPKTMLPMRFPQNPHLFLPLCCLAFLVSSQGILAIETNTPPVSNSTPTIIFGVIMQKTPNGLLVHRQYFPVVQKVIEIKEEIARLNSRRNQSLSSERKLLAQELTRLKSELQINEKAAGTSLEQIGKLQPIDAGKTIFFVGHPNEAAFVDDDNFSAPAFIAGTFEYTNVAGAVKTVRRYAATQELAEKLSQGNAKQTKDR